MIIKLKNADFSANNIGTLSTWTVTRVLGSGATYDGLLYVDKNAALNATVTISDGYELGDAGVVVTMGGEAVTSGVTVDGNTITIAIASVTGNVVIKVPTINISTGEEEEPEIPTDPNPGEGEESDLTYLSLYKSAIGTTILDYQDSWKLFKADLLLPLGSNVIGVDVSAYTGQSIHITAAQSVIDGANYAMFCSELPNGQINSLEELQGFEFVGSDNYILEDRNKIIESFNISTVTETTNTMTKVVPTNAKYLMFANLGTKCSNPSVVIGDVSKLLTTYTTEQGWCSLDYNEYFYVSANATFKDTYQSIVVALDVSDLVGESLSITATQPVVENAYYSFFTNALPSGISSIEEINGLAYTTTTKYNFEEASLVENFNVSVENNIQNTITKVVPTGAKYLFIASMSAHGNFDIRLV